MGVHKIILLLSQISISLAKTPAWVDNILKADYMQNEAPIPSGPAALKIKTEILIWSINSVNVPKMEMETDVIVRLEWDDFRFRIPKVNETKRVTLNRKMAGMLWTPMLAFRNCKKGTILQFNKISHKLELRNRTVTTVYRKLSPFFCSFDLRSYPLDVQHCKIRVANLNDDISQVELIHTGSDLSILSNNTLPQYDILTITKGNCTTTIGRTTESCLELDVVLKRQLANHMMQTYLPSLIVVILSWISFWIDVTAVPARCGLGLTSLLTLATQFSNVNRSLPPVSYIKALDLWMFTCMFLVFSSLMEFAISSYSIRSYNQKKSVVAVAPAEGESKMKELRSPLTADGTPKMDKISRKLFPISFLIFNIAYWTYFNIIENKKVTMKFEGL